MIGYFYLYCGTTAAITYYSSPYEYSDGTTLTLELNMNERALFYWVNRMLVPHAVVNIPIGVYFGVLIFLFFFIN
jgi:hypothetical protein